MNDQSCEPEYGTVTRYIRELQVADLRENAAHMLWRRFYDEATRIAHGHFNRLSAPRTMADAEDIAATALTGLLMAIYERGRQISNREEFLRLLNTAISRDAANHRQYEWRLVRDSRRNTSLDVDAPPQLVGWEPAPEQVDLAREAAMKLFDEIPNREFQLILLARLLGTKLAELPRVTGLPPSDVTLCFKWLAEWATKNLDNNSISDHFSGQLRMALVKVLPPDPQPEPTHG